MQTTPKIWGKGFVVVVIIVYGGFQIIRIDFRVHLLTC